MSFWLIRKRIKIAFVEPFNSLKTAAYFFREGSRKFKNTVIDNKH
ncbi:hypothetical protein [Rahnella variigena]|nr:hypothetical protein [Rahnella variigena]